MLNPPIVQLYRTQHLLSKKKNICNTPRGIAIRLRRICDDDETFEKRSSEYQNYLIARDHKPSTVKKQFSEVKKKTRSKCRQKQTKQDKVSDLKLISTYSPALPDIHNITQNNLSILHTDENMKKFFLSKSIKTFYRREKKPERNFTMEIAGDTG